eukprot:scaffold12169_cov116-Isochrysis_galbana.AAC.2
MGNTSFGGRARCGCRSVPGNVGVGTSPSAGPRALQPGGQRARMAPRRAPWLWKLIGAARPAFPAQDGPAGIIGTGRFAVASAERRGSWDVAAAVGAAAAPRPGGRSSSISIPMMSPVPTPRCAIFPRSARFCAGLLQLASPPTRFSTGPQPAIPYPRVHLSWGGMLKLFMAPGPAIAQARGGVSAAANQTRVGGWLWVLEAAADSQAWVAGSAAASG